VIQRQEVDRIDGWVKEAVSQGAKVLTGGEGDGPVLPADPDRRRRAEMKVCREEIFGPVVTISPYQTFEDALRVVNDSRYGLQAGVFTERHQPRVRGAPHDRRRRRDRERRVGVPGRPDAVRRLEGLGFGREGLQYAMDEMTEPRIMVLSNIPL
jgi:glyceraldehyde-3-phosphate dehydrogenase (NADP+)